MKNTKKLLALLLVVVMTMALGTAAFAADTSDITINTTNNHTYKIYQLLKGDVSASVSGGDVDKLANITAGANLNTTDVDAFIAAVKDLTGEALGDAAATYITGDPTEVVGDGNAKTVTVDNGYYIIVDTYTGPAVTDGSDTVSRYMVNVVGDTEVTPKTSTPDIDKQIVDTDANAALDTDKKVDTASVGDTIEFEITGKVPDTTGYATYYYAVNDTMSEGLTLNADSFVVTIGGKTLTKGTDYTVTVSAQTFKLVMSDLRAMVDNTTDYAAVATNAAISIKYNATVNEKAVIGTDANTNTAKLEYSNNPNDDTVHGEGPDKQTKTFVTEISIVKVDQDGMPLAGAGFTIAGDNLNEIAVETTTTFELKTVAGANDGDYYALADGTYTKTAPTTDTAALYVGGDAATKDYVLKTITKATTSYVDATGNDVEAVTDADGVVTFVGLHAGTYTLTETTTPEGYNTLAAPVTVEITATLDSDGNVVWTVSDPLVNNDGAIVVPVVNNAGTILPSTGGIGTTIFYIVGAILLVGAGVILVTRKRVGEEG